MQCRDGPAHLLRFGAGEVFAAVAHCYDGLGRLTQSKVQMPGGWSTVVHTYDAMGRASAVSAPEYGTSGCGTFTPSHWTTYSYDPFGRQVKVTLPDGTSTQTTYVGSRQVTRQTLDANGGVSPQGNGTTESYDGHGRLGSVQEPSGPSGGEVTTTYQYDVGNRLASVSTTSGTTTQPRSFSYDLRGFLTAESHPEVGGMKRYTYDARGHVRSSSIDGAPAFALTFDYDHAERLTTVTGPSGALKSFEFGTTNDNGRGRLVTQTRHNPVNNADAAVTDIFQYDANGRVTQKTTRIENPSGTTIQTFTQIYTLDDLGEPTTIDYPFTSLSRQKFSQQFVNGLLTGITNQTTSTAIASLTYHPTGLVNTVTHADGTLAPTDTYSADSSGMARPGSVTFSGYSNCSIGRPDVSVPASACPGSSGNVASTVAVDGTTYAWNITGGTMTSGSNTATLVFTAAASGSVTLTLTVTNDCGTQTFTVATIPISAPAATVSGSTTIGPGQSASIRADLTGTGNWSLLWSDGTSETATATPWFRTVHPQTTTTYTLSSFSDSHCAGTVSGSAVVTVSSPPPAPSPVNAYATSTTSVQVTWSPVTGVDGYKVYRSDVGALTPQPIAATSFLNDSLTAGTAYLYYVHSVKGGVESADSAVDLATTVMFTDDPQNRIRAVDVTDLRTAVNAVCARAALGACVDTSSLNGVVVLGKHIQDLRVALNNARHQLNLPLLTFTDANVDPNTNGGQRLPIRKVHINELRGGVQ